MSKIYAGKVDLTTNPNDRINKVVADDFNEIASDIERLENLNDEIGLNWDSVADTYERTGALASFGVDDSVPNSLLPIQSQMRRCTLNTDGTVNYYLDSWDSTKKVDGTTSTLTGVDGNIMVEIPEHWYKYSVDGGIYSWRVSVAEKVGYAHSPKRYIGAYDATESDGKLQSVSGVTATVLKTITEYRDYAKAIVSSEYKWHLFDNETLKVIRILYLTEYASFNSQAKIGMGNTQKAIASINVNGLSDGDGNQTANSSTGGGATTDYMSYRGIENLYGNVAQLIDGVAVMIDTTVEVYVCNDPEQYHTYGDNTTDPVATGYASIGETTTDIDYEKVPLVNEFFPISLQSQSDEFMCDKYQCSSNLSIGWRAYVIGGNSADDSDVGVFYNKVASAFSSAQSHIGTRLCYTDLS